MVRFSQCQQLSVSSNRWKLSKLLLEKSKGEKSRYEAYIQSVPRDFTVPVCLGTFKTLNSDCTYNLIWFKLSPEPELFNLLPLQLQHRAGREKGRMIQKFEKIKSILKCNKLEMIYNEDNCLWAYAVLKTRLMTAHGLRYPDIIKGSSSN